MSNMSLIWFGIVLLSGSWLFLTSVITPANNLNGLLFILAGCFCNIISVRKMHIGQIDNKYYFICLPIMICSLFIPFPYNIGFLFILIGILAIALRDYLKLFSGIGIGFVVSGFILIIQTAVLPLFFKFSIVYRHLDFLTPFIFLLLKILGLKCTWHQNSFFIQSVEEVFKFTPLVENLAVNLSLNLFLGTLIIVLLFVRHHRCKWIVFVITTSIVYLLIRFVGIIILYLDFQFIDVFWNPWVCILSFVPLIFIFVKYVPLVNEDLINFHRTTLLVTTKECFTIAGTIVSIFLLISSWGFHDPGMMKKGRIVIDERHSNWEWTTQEYDTRWFGEKSGYNYYCLWNYLNYYYNVERNFEPLTFQLLDNFDVLIIKTPTSAFSDEEITHIQEFVKKGGGLFLIGDHTNVFGTSTHINLVAKHFGLRFNYDATYDLSNGGLSVYMPPSLFPHPIVQNINTFLFGTSCSLEVPWQTEDVIIGYGLKSLEHDYSKRNFFPEKDYASMSFGLFNQLAAIKYGKGRVVAFTDSTVFSNFWMFVPGKPELLLGSVNWLNRQNYIPYNINHILFIAGFFILALIILLSLKNGIGFHLVLFSCFLTFPIVSFFFQFLNTKIYSAPHPHTKYIQICFEMEHSDFFLPITELVSKSERNYHTFYVWIQRLKYVPMALPKLQQSLKEGDVVVIINPINHFTAKDKKQIIDYITHGGKILLLDSSLNKNSSANEILQEFDMNIDYMPLANSVFSDNSGQKISNSQYAVTIKGGTPLLLTDDGKPILSTVKKGKGIFTVMTDSLLFSEIGLGTTSTIPTPEQKKLYEFEFWLLNKLVDNLGN